MNLKDLANEYDIMQRKYGSLDLDSIYGGGCENNSDICFVFMNPTKRNIASSKKWKGLKVPWIGIKNIWKLFFEIGLLDEDIYKEIRNISGPLWNYEFAEKVYSDVKKHKYFITNLGKCTQDDARALSDSVFYEYLGLLEKEIEIVNPKVIVLFGNQVSSIVLEKKISVSKCRREKFIKEINGKQYKFYSVFYPIGNGSFNIDKAIFDIRWIIDKELPSNKVSES